MSVSFSTPVSYAAGSQTLGVTTADLTGNGERDILAASEGWPDSGTIYGDGLYLLTNDGSGGFLPAVNLDPGNITGVSTADLTGDGEQDIVVTRLSLTSENGFVDVLINNRSGGFLPIVSYAAGIEPTAVTTADLTGNGLPDIIVTDNGLIGADNGSPGFVYVMMNNGSGAFLPSVTYTVGSNPVSVTTADLVGNGEQEIIVADQQGGVDVLMNNGTGDFLPAVTYTTGPSPESVTTADLTGNGEQDIVVAYGDDSDVPGSGGVDVLMNNGSGGFLPAVSYSAGQSPSAVTTADLTGNGLPDIVVTASDYSDTGSAVDILLNDGHGGFLPAISEPVGIYLDAVAVADLTGNGQPDIIVGDAGYTETPGSGGVDVLSNLTETACYCRGTRILTETGEKPVEELAIGEKLVTRAWEARALRWIGRRHYAGRFAARNADILPVRIRAGALEDHLPQRDLQVSPLHAMYLDGVLVPAIRLVNGVSITQLQSVEEVEYFHLELDSHDVILAEGAPAESFVDDDSRMMFHNAAEYAQLYPNLPREPALYCAPRVTDGYALASIRRRLAIRAGIGAACERRTLRGFVDRVGREVVEGWAQTSEQPEIPVCLDVLVAGVVVAQTLANRYRADLCAAGLGSGRHGFLVRLTTPLSAAQRRRVEVRRALDLRTLPHHRADWRAA